MTTTGWPVTPGTPPVGARLAADRVERVLARGPGPAGGRYDVNIADTSRSGPVRWPEGYVPDRARRYGEATFWYGLRAGTVRHEPP